MAKVIREKDRCVLRADVPTYTYTSDGKRTYKTIREYFYGINRVADAHARAAELEHRRYKGKVTVSDVPIHQLVSSMLAYKSLRKHAKTIKRMESARKPIESWLEYNGITSITLLKKRHIDEYILYRQAQNKAYDTIRNEINVITSALKYGVAHDIISDNPLAGLDIPHQTHTRPDIPHVETIYTLFAHIERWEDFKLFYFILALGSRLGETIALRSDDISGNVINYHRETKRGYQRHVRVPDEIDPVIYTAEPDNEYVHTDITGKPYTRRKAYARLHVACKASGVSEITKVHTLRACHATYTIAASRSKAVFSRDTIHSLQQRCGWRNISTMDHYINTAMSYDIDSFLPPIPERFGCYFTRFSANLGKSKILKAT